MPPSPPHSAPLPFALRPFICYERDGQGPDEQLSLFPGERDAGVSYFDVLVGNGTYIRKDPVRPRSGLSGPRIPNA